MTTLRIALTFALCYLASATFERFRHVVEVRASKHAEKLRRGLCAGVVAHTTYGDVLGVDDGKVRQFLGIPFAGPPTGAARWRPPQPLAPWTTTRNATWWGPACPENPLFSFWGLITGTDEDCLTLNVYIPSVTNRTAPTSGWPIMIFWYGGSWEMGSSGFPLYDADADIGLMEDVIVVTSNYRINAFGFLAGDELREESPDGSVGNYGLLDQRAALKFVYDNAAAFGGDQKRITLWGESAGAGSVSHHLTMPASWPYFTAAAMESGPFAPWISRPYNISASQFPKFASNLNCSQAPGPSRLACLRAIPWQTIVASGLTNITRGIITWAPTIDGVTVLDDPRHLAAAGAIAPVPVLMGTNQDEGTFFIQPFLVGGAAPSYTLQPEQYTPAMATILGQPLADEIASHYPPDLYNGSSAASSALWTLSHVVGDWVMTCATRDSARWLTSSSRQGGPRSTYVYFFAHILGLLQVLDDFIPLGAAHGSELPLVFDFGLVLSSAESALASAMVKYWTNVAVYGDPNGAGGLPLWPAYNATSDEVLMLDTATNGGFNATVVRGLKGNACDWWASQPDTPKWVIFDNPACNGGI